MNRVNNLLLHNLIPITLHDNLQTFRETGKVFEMKGKLSKTITIKICNVDVASLSDKKNNVWFTNEYNFDLKAQGNKNTRDRTFIKLLKTPGLMVSASGVSKTKLSSDPNEVYDRLKWILQKKQVGKNSDTFNEQIIAIVDNFLEYKCKF